MTEDLAPEGLVGWHVVEVGMRQAWPFLAPADPRSGREARTLIDAPVRVSPGTRSMTRGDEGLLPGLNRVKTMIVSSVLTAGDDLELRLEDWVVWIGGRGYEQTAHSPWGICPQGPA